MKRACMVTLDYKNIAKIKELGLNLSQTIDKLLVKYIEELTPKTLDEWNANYERNKAKSNASWVEWEKNLVVVHGD